MSIYEVDLKNYFQAMREGNIDVCCDIEIKHDLYGYPPDLVTTVLDAAAKGADMQLAVEDYFGDKK